MTGREIQLYRHLGYIIYVVGREIQLNRHQGYKWQVARYSFIDTRNRYMAGKELQRHQG